MWNLLHVSPQSQAKYVDHIRDRFPHVDLYFPQYQRLTRPSGTRQPRLTERPVYPGYIFARPHDNDDIHALRRAPVRAYVIRFGLVFSMVPESVINELKRKERLNLLIQETKIESPYYPGRKIIIHTPIADIQAIIVRLMGDQKAVCDTPIGEWSVFVHQIALR